MHTLGGKGAESRLNGDEDQRMQGTPSLSTNYTECPKMARTVRQGQSWPNRSLSGISMLSGNAVQHGQVLQENDRRRESRKGNGTIRLSYLRPCSRLRRYNEALRMPDETSTAHCNSNSPHPILPLLRNEARLPAVLVGNDLKVFLSCVDRSLF